MKVKVLQNILNANDQLAQRNKKLLTANKTLTLNIMASPGAGKTSFIMGTIARLKDELTIGVIEGDIASTIDADKIGKEGIDVVQINTGGGCHLDANMVENALKSLDTSKLDLLFIENVGNLVCPAAFKLGEHLRIVISSVPEGNDKPHKYPAMFSDAEAVILNKTDLLPVLDYDLKDFKDTVKGLNSAAPIFQISSTTGEGFEKWIYWLRGEFKKLKD
ncbi:MAG: hydrogenase nickel incorporation protein HypB [Chloroflexi bacterium]|nr:hydrogenase nickel incorporation protein HypB [Chloroflexota bacterium]